MKFLGQQVTPKDLALIREVVTTCDGLSRSELANTVCELLDWKRPLGSLKGRECGEFLDRLESKGLLRLPDKRQGRPVGSRTEVPVTELGEPGISLVGSAGSLGRIEFKQVQTEDLRTRLVYEVRVRVPNPRNELRLGMPATVVLLPQEGAPPAGPATGGSE